MYGAGQFLGNFVTFEALGRMSADDFALAEARTDRLMSRIGYWNLPRLSQYSLKSAVKEYDVSIANVTRQTAPRTGRTVAEEAATQNKRQKTSTEDSDDSDDSADEKKEGEGAHAAENTAAPASNEEAATA